MRNLKKLLALIVAICVIATFTVPAFAADAAAAAPSDSKICSDLGVLQGDGNGVTDAYLAKGTTRLQAAIIYLRLMGKEDEALAETSTDNFADASKITWAQGKNVLAYLKKNPSLGWQGDGTNFDPNGAASAQMIYKVMLTALGYVQDTDFAYADAVSFAGSKGLTKIAYTTKLTNNDLAIALVETLKTKIKDGSKSLAEDLIAKNIITAAAADATGLVPAYKPVALDASGAVALNSKIVEITLGTAATDADVKAAAITVKDAAGKAIAVTGVKFSPWSTDGKSVLATLESDTVAGTLYTATVGTKSVNFGGKAKDTDAPASPAAVSTDYNEVVLTFGEAIDINTAKVTIAKKYGDKSALATSAVKYDGSNKLVYTTADQADATLYGVTVEGVADMAGNVMTKDDTITFVGKSKPTGNEVVKGAKAIDYKTIYVELGLKVDPATVTAANFTLAEMYGTKASVAIASAALATTTQAGKYNSSYSDDQKTLASKKDVVLTLTGEVKDATLYKVIAANLKTLYGVAESTTEADTYATFTGKSKPGPDSLTYTATATSNTTVKLTFANDLDQASAENIANYSVAKAYGDKAALAVTKASLDSNVVTLTVAAMAIDMYKVTAINIKDVYGNSIKTSSDANIQSFAGKAVAAKIDGLGAAGIVDTTGTNGKITVQFNGNFGTGGLDVASYFIDKGIGYPSKVEKVDDSTVALYVPKTELGTLYTLTIKGVSNSDGVAMDSAGFSKTFVGTGAVATKAKLDAAYALDSKTVKLYFSKNVEDIAGFDTTSAATLAGSIAISGGNGTSLGAVSHAYIDPADKTAIIAYSTTSDFKDGGSDDMYIATINAAVTGVDTTANAKTFAENTNDAAKIGVSGVVAVNNKTLDIYFNQPVRFLDHGFAYVETGATTGFQAGVDSAILATRSIASDNTVWEVSLDKALTNVQYSLVLNAFSNTLISNIDTGVTLNVLSDTLSYAFAGNGSESLYVSDVYAVGVDTRTIKVMFPEDMNSTEAGNSVNYAVYGTVAGTDTLVSAGKIALASYDSKVVTLTTNNDFTTTADGRYYLVVSSAIHNALGTKTVLKDATTPVRTEFALGTASPAKLLVKEVSASGQNITITFNQRFTTVADVTYAVNSSAEVLKYLKIKVNGSTELAAADINNVVAKLGSTAGPSTSSVDTIVITVGPALTVNGQGTVELVNTATATGINNQTQDTGMSPVVFVQKP